MQFKHRWIGTTTRIVCRRQCIFSQLSTQHQKIESLLLLWLRENRKALCTSLLTMMDIDKTLFAVWAWFVSARILSCSGVWGDTVETWAIIITWWHADHLRTGEQGVSCLNIAWPPRMMTQTICGDIWSIIQQFSLLTSVWSMLHLSTLSEIDTLESNM